MIAMRWACIYLPHLALDAVLRNLPDPGRPVALVTGPAQKRTLVAVNDVAQGFGLRPGMGFSAAQVLVSDFVSVEYDAAQVEHWHRFLAAWAYRFSSQVCLAFDNSVVLEIGHSLKLFGPWPQFERRLRDELRQLGFSHQLAVAPNPTAARALAGAHDGLAIGESHLDHALGQLPLELAGIEPDVVDSLQRMGVFKLRQVMCLPRTSLGKRFGQALLSHLDHLHGVVMTPPEFYRPPDRFDLRIEFEYEVESSQALLFPLRRLTSDLAAYLAGRDGGVQRFHVLLEHESIPATPVTIGLLAPQREAPILFDLSKGRLEQIQVPAAVRGMRLIANELPSFVPASQDLFEARSQQSMSWDQLRERLRSRLGDDSVYRLRVFPDHRPEHAWRAGIRENDVAHDVDASQWPSRPAWLLSQPILLRDTRVQYLSGPERIETGWWDSHGIRRDYYQVRTSLGQHAWAWCHAGVRPGEDGSGLMLQGWFA